MKVDMDAALDRLERFAGRISSDLVVDAETGLTGADLKAVATRFGGIVSVRMIDLSDGLGFSGLQPICGGSAHDPTQR